MRVLVCGGRDYNTVGDAHKILNALCQLRQFTCVIHGAAPGADTIAANWAKHNGIPVEAYPADWNKWGARAGPMRNAQMLREGRPDLVVAFAGGRGTANMIHQAEKAGVRVFRVPIMPTS